MNKNAYVDSFFLFVFFLSVFLFFLNFCLLSYFEVIRCTVKSVIATSNFFLLKCKWIWSFICCKNKLKKHFFFEKNFSFYKIYIICRKKKFYMEKKFILIFFLLKKLFLQKMKKNIYISHLSNIFLSIKYIFILQKTFFWW